MVKPECDRQFPRFVRKEGSTVKKLLVVLALLVVFTGGMVGCSKESSPSKPGTPAKTP
jgi:hypothetical protein